MFTYDVRFAKISKFEPKTKKHVVHTDKFKKRIVNLLAVSKVLGKTNYLSFSPLLKSYVKKQLGVYAAPMKAKTPNHITFSQV
jgi:hypothetical protein